MVAHALCTRVFVHLFAPGGGGAGRRSPPQATTGPAGRPAGGQLPQNVPEGAG